MASFIMESLENEIWKDVTDFESHYQISSFGRVKSIIRPDYHKILKHRTARGYYMVNLSKDSKTYYRKIHRLVALAFLEIDITRSIVNHKNGIKTDNRVENLEWVNDCENATHGLLSLNKTSKFTGVSWREKTKKWRVYIYENRKYIHGGYFDTEEQASEVYIRLFNERNMVNKYVQSV